MLVRALEEAEKPYPIAVSLVVQPVLDRRNAADHLAIAFGEQVFGAAVLEEGVLGAGEQSRHVPTQRRDPERVPRVEPVGQIDEAPEIPLVARRSDARGCGQMTPSS